MQLTLFITTFIALLAVIVYLCYRIYLDHKIFGATCATLDVFVERLEDLCVNTGDIAQALFNDSPDPDLDYDANDYIDAGFVDAEYSEN